MQFLNGNSGGLKQLILCMLLLSGLSSCYMFRAYKNRKLDLSSHEKLPFTDINKGKTFFSFAEGILEKERAMKLDSVLQGTGTAAFLIIRNDSIVYENYFNGFNKTSLLPSFSVVKSFVSTLVHIAHKEGKIKSLQQPLTDYLPGFLSKDKRFAGITIQHLLDMRSGLKWNEGSYNLKDDAIKMGFRPNITPYIYKVKVEKAPGDFEYQSINTMLLAMIAEKATGKSISAYLSEKLWQPLGMEYPATWSSDKKKREIAYAGLNATARDFARFGRLYLHKGDWNGEQLLSPEWIDSSVSQQAMFAYGGYRNQFWGAYGHREFADSGLAVIAAGLMEGTNGKVRSYITKEGIKKYFVTYSTASYYALGILGQYIFINPVNNTIIVRVGHNWKSGGYRSLQSFIQSLSESL